MRPVFDVESTHGSIDAALARLAARQHGVFGRSQAKALGYSRGLIEARMRSGRWEKLDAFTFRIPGAPPSWPQRLMAGCLGWGEDSAASHASAAALRRLVSFPPGPIELIVPRGRNRAVAQAAVVYRRDLDPADITVVQGIPATTLPRTFLDLAATAKSTRVEEALDDALNRGLITIARLRRYAVEAARRQPGVALLRSLLDARDGGSVPESVFETRMLRLLTDAGLPRPVLQHPVFDVNGRVSARLDFAYPAQRIAIETDGRRWHAGRIRWQRDRARLNALTLAGWRVIHVIWDHLVQHPERVVARVRDALQLPEVPRRD